MFQIAIDIAIPCLILYWFVKGIFWVREKMKSKGEKK